jgi:hypothetical protein
MSCFSQNSSIYCVVSINLALNIAALHAQSLGTTSTLFRMVVSYYQLTALCPHA